MAHNTLAEKKKGDIGREGLTYSRLFSLSCCWVESIINTL